MFKNKRIPYLLLFFNVGLGGCQTFFPPQNVPLPSQTERLFGDCSVGDGTLAGVLESPQIGLARIDLDWMTNDPVWQIEMQTPLGESLLYLDRQAEAFETSGVLSTHLQPISLSSKNQLMWNREALPFRETDLFCFFAMKFPRNWLDVPRRQKDKTRFDFETSSGPVELEFSGQATWPICATQYHRYGWIFSHKVYRVCLNPQKKQGLFELGDVKMEWSAID